MTHDWPARVRVAWLTARAWCSLLYFDLLSLLGFAHVHSRIGSTAVRTRTDMSSSQPTIEDIVWCVDEACVWYVKRAMCLQRSVVATRLLRRYGHRAELVIGYRPLPFESHAWVEVDAQVVNDRQQYRKIFSVLERL